LQASPDRDDLVRVHAPVRLLASGQLLDIAGDCRHSGGATDQHYLMDVGEFDPGFLDHPAKRAFAAVQQVGGHPLEPAAG